MLPFKGPDHLLSYLIKKEIGMYIHLYLDGINGTRFKKTFYDAVHYRLIIGADDDQVHGKPYCKIALHT